MVALGRSLGWGAWVGRRAHRFWDAKNAYILHEEGPDDQKVDDLVSDLVVEEHAHLDARVAPLLAREPDAR